MKVAVACGGTGGHIYPGLAVADVLKARGHHVTLWLGGRDVEAMSTKGKWDGDIISVPARGFSGGMSMGGLLVAFGLLSAALKCRKIMKASRPDVLIAMGSYSSVGPVLAARWLKIPVVLHESNAVPGRAISFLSKFASVVALAFDSASDHFKNVKTVTTGFPVRTDLNAKFEEGVLLNGCFNLLVMGGSQGAHRLNELTVSAASALAKENVKLQVIHLAGRADESEVRAAYREAKVPAVVFGFLENMGKAYSSADMAIARSGSASCTELMVSSVPTLFVPFPFAVRNHQYENALSVASSGAADVIEEKDLSPERLADYIRELISKPDKLSEMKKATGSVAFSDAADRLAELVEKTAQSG